MITRSRAVTLRFLAAPTDVAFFGDSAVGGGRILEWIDKAAYACAVGWSGGYCVTAYIGNVDFSRPVNSGELVEVTATLTYTGRSSMHIEVVVSAANPRTGVYQAATSCTVIFVAVGDGGRPVPVQQWRPITEHDEQSASTAIEKVAVRAAIEAAMAGQVYTPDSDASRAMLRFLAAPTDVNWGGKTHGGTVARWIDEAAYLCAARWSSAMCLAAYSGGIRFYRPIPIGHVVEIQAQLLYTGSSAMHISVHVRSADPRNPELQLTTHCLTVFVAVDEHRHPVMVPCWAPKTVEDQALETHAKELIVLRAQLAPVYPS